MKVCLFGGTFDPPHNGHLAIARQCRQELNLKRVYFIPAFLAPHKTNLKIADARHRLAMLNLAVQNESGFEILKFELERQGISYSIDTILAVKREFHLGKKDLYFLIGADSFTEFNTWREPERILDECRVVVAGRPGFSIDRVPQAYRQKVVVLSNPLMTVSSTDIRQRIQKHLSVDELIPEPVLDYIRKNKLYQN